MLSRLWASLWPYFIGGAVLLALWGGFKYYKAKAERLAAEKAVAEKTLEVERDQKEREKKVDKMGEEDILKYWGAQPAPGADPERVRPKNPGPGKAPPATETRLGILGCGQK